jgi:long-chain acyl-CoA synthetase
LSSLPIATLAELFLEIAARDQPECLLEKRRGRYRAVSAAELANRVRRLHEALRKLGIAAGDRVALVAENSVDWPVVDFATLSLGAVLTPVYPTLTAEQSAFIIDDSGSRIAFVQGRARLRELRRLRATMPSVEHFVLLPDPADEPDSPDAEALDVPDLTTLLAGATEPDPAAFETRARSVSPDDLATLIYTSGTTGRPKGVRLTHRNITSNVLASLEAIDFRGTYTALCFLPLCHSFERTVDYCYFTKGLTIAYAESVHTVAENILEVRPHVFVSVPRVYEKMLATVRENVARAGPLRRRLFAWAERTGRRAIEDRLADRMPPGLLGLQLRVADRLVFGKIKRRLGGRFEFAVSGGAPLAPEVASFFWAAGVRILEGYGLSETAPVLTVNRLGATRLGTVGPAIPGVELRIADDGEILARGPNIMPGYHDLPEETAEVIDDEGWFHTGDIGEFDEAWHLRITGRKKEIIVNAYGKNVAPAPIENALKASPYIAQAVVVGDRRKFLSALLVPDFDALAAWAAQHDLGALDPERLLDNERVRNLVGYAVAQVNEGVSRHEQIKAWDLLEDDFTIESGELTPTQKVKRNVVTERYADLIDRIYERAEKPA